MGPLANYICGVAPAIATRCPSWRHNEGYGLGGEDARALANILQAEIASGRTEAYRTNNEREIAAPRPNTPESSLTAMLTSTGYECLPDKYHFSVENVQEFAAFLRDSGGFEIW